MCGILGIINKDENKFVNQSLVDGLTILQHRGQDAAGVSTIYKNRYHMYKNRGIVSEVFNESNIIELKGNVGIGHVRYSTIETCEIFEAQPLYTNVPYGISLVHNGNITNTGEIKKEMVNSNIHINTNSDSELLLHLWTFKTPTL